MKMMKYGQAGFKMDNYTEMHTVYMRKVCRFIKKDGLKKEFIFIMILKMILKSNSLN